MSPSLTWFWRIMEQEVVLLHFESSDEPSIDGDEQHGRGRGFRSTKREECDGGIRAVRE